MAYMAYDHDFRLAAQLNLIIGAFDIMILDPYEGRCTFVHTFYFSTKS